jgi:hypothetical protein
MTREEADFIGAMNMCDEISNEAYKKIMCHCEVQEPCEDAISRQAAIRWVKTECNPYGKPTLDFESGKKVIEHLKQMPSVTPKQKTGHLKLVERGKHIDLCCSNCGAVRIKDIAYNYTTDELSKMEDFKNLLKHSEMSYCPSCGAEMVEPQESETQNDT